MLDPVKLRLNYAHDLSDSSSILLVARIKPSLDLEPVAVFEKKKGEKKNAARLICIPTGDRPFRSFSPSPSLRFH